MGFQSERLEKISLYLTLITTLPACYGKLNKYVCIIKRIHEIKRNRQQAFFVELLLRKDVLSFSHKVPTLKPLQTTD